VGSAWGCEGRDLHHELHGLIDQTFLLGRCGRGFRPLQQPAGLVEGLVVLLEVGGAARLQPGRKVGCHSPCSGAATLTSQIHTFCQDVHPPPPSSFPSPPRFANNVRKMQRPPLVSGNAYNMGRQLPPPPRRDAHNIGKGGIVYCVEFESARGVGVEVGVGRGGGVSPDAVRCSVTSTEMSCAATVSPPGLQTRSRSFNLLSAVRVASSSLAVRRAMWWRLRMLSRKQLSAARTTKPLTHATLEVV